MELPLFPLHNVLCPGVALPLHIFEERYRLMIGHCIEESEPFGVVLIREGREVGELDGRLAEIGTTALIRQAGRYPDGRLDIMTVGGRRFRLQAVHRDRASYLVGDVTMLDEPVGEERTARALSNRVGRQFLRYLELLQPALAGDGDGPEIEVEIEVEVESDEATSAPSGPRPTSERTELVPTEPGLQTPGRVDVNLSRLTDSERRDVLMSAARRLTAPGDPTALSFLLTGLVQIELSARQTLLEAPDTVRRLSDLESLLRREIQLLSRQLKPLTLDPRLLALRRN